MTRTSTEQPEALMRLADNYAEACFDQGLNQRTTDDKPETERGKLENAIRHQHARIEELEEQLSAIGAGGVEPLRKQVSAPQAVHPENIREGAPYDNPEFEQLARNMGVWGTPQAALCAQFWLAATHPTQQGLEQAIKWPKAPDVGRFGDMSPDAFIRVGLDSDNDVYVSICDGNSVSDIEFCTPGGGGGQSSRTRMALIALMCAIEADNASHPSFDFWQRSIAAQAKKERKKKANG